MAFFENLVRTIILPVLMIVIGILEAWTALSLGLWPFGVSLPGLVFVPPLSRWPAMTILVFAVVLETLSYLVLNRWWHGRRKPGLF